MSDGTVCACPTSRTPTRKITIAAKPQRGDLFIETPPQPNIPFLFFSGAVFGFSPCATSQSAIHPIRRNSPAAASLKNKKYIAGHTEPIKRPPRSEEHTSELQSRGPYL